jgi:hypothetical protein
MSTMRVITAPLVLAMVQGTFRRAIGCEGTVRSGGHHSPERELRREGNVPENLIETLPDATAILNQTNRLAGLPREEQVAALTPAIVQVVNQRVSVGSDSRRAPAATKTDDPPSAEGRTREQVLAMLGRPSLTETTDGVALWYYDTPQGTLKVYFYQGTASLRRPR